MALKVCVIGAGMAGIVALRRMLDKPKMFQPLAFEMAEGVGGTWWYSDRSGTDEKGIPVFSSMYKNLRTNIPKELMALPGFPYPSHLPSFVGHQDVLQYLKDYTSHFKLHNYIQFNTKVESVHPLNEHQHKWQVVTRNLEEHGSAPSDPELHYFDAVLVCNGHFSVPRMPCTPGLDTFVGQKLHSHDYRHPENFSGLRVLCLGAGFSGIDISLDLAPHANEIYLSNRNSPHMSPLPNNVHQKPAIDHIQGNCVHFDNGESVQVDAVICCTGYEYTFPFLTRACHTHVFDKKVMPLYKHIIHTEHPTMGFIGLCKDVCPSILFDCQVQFFLASLDGSLKLTTKDAMDAETQKYYDWCSAQKIPTRQTHVLGERQWEYYETLAQLANFEPVPQVYEELFTAVLHDLLTNITGLKKKNYEILDARNYRVSRNASYQ